jgi:voltage-gated potassium channel
MKKYVDTVGELLVYYLLIVFSSAALFAFIEARTINDSIWWAFVTALSIGYGDVVPTTLAGRILTILLANIVLLGIVPLMVYLINKKVYNAE